MDELKPCPKCNGKAEIVDNNYMWKYIHCTQCGNYGDTYLAKDREKMIKSWNRRAGEDEI